MTYIVDLSKVNLSHIHLVGGKNASTGEMIQHLSRKGILIPGGFATTSTAFKHFLSQHKLDTKIYKALSSLTSSDLRSLQRLSRQIRQWIIATPFPPELIKEISSSYAKLKNATVAVRSSATAEDLANASFAGAQETYLNVKGIAKLLKSIKLVYASLYTARAIAYRRDQHFNEKKVALSVGIQPMVRSDLGTSGVMFTLDTESGFDKVILINASYGLGEAIVQGQVNPDEFIVYKPALKNKKMSILQRRLGDKTIKMVYNKTEDPHKLIKTVKVKEADQLRFCLSDKEIQTLAEQAILIEQHYKRPMDIEWAKDGITGKLVILQARPETVRSHLKGQVIERYTLSKKGHVLATGQSIGQRIASGIAKIILHPNNMHAIKPGQIIVTDMTDPDWEPVMKLAGGIITNRGGRTCHAAIVARELGIPAVVGCGNATTTIKDNQLVTMSCAEGQNGYVYAGQLPFKVSKTPIDKLPALPVKLCVNIGNPEMAFATQFIPNGGVGLARLEFIISGIGVHPNALLQFNKLPKKLKQQITLKTAAYKNPVEFYIEKLREGISMLAAAFFPKQVIFRFSDFKSNEYSNLLGGNLFEPLEENPMIGFRGASRYANERFRRAFELECAAFKRVREAMGLTNAQLMIPFVRTVAELKEVIKVIESQGLKRGKGGLKIYMMCEIPSNVLLANEFLKYVDGFSIGSNDLTQLVLGLDRDSSIVSNLFDERNPAVKLLLQSAIKACIKQNKYIGICGQAPSDHPDMATWLMHEGIESMSLNPDSIIETWLTLAKSI